MTLDLKIEVVKFLSLLFTFTHAVGCIREKKNRSREYSKGNKTVPGKVATTHTEDGHKQDT